MTVPRYVLRFEVAVYLSLMLDTLSAAIQSASSEQFDPAVHIVNALFILGFVFLVEHAARRRKNWARLTLLAALALSALSLVATLSAQGLELTSGIDLISVVLTAFGLYSSFTGDARGWFTE